MLFAILFDENDILVAAAPAALQVAVGDAFWSEIYAGTIEGYQSRSNWQSFQTGYLSITDAQLQVKLNSLETDDRFLPDCVAAVSQIIGLENPSLNRAA